MQVPGFLKHAPNAARTLRPEAGSIASIETRSGIVLPSLELVAKLQGVERVAVGGLLALGGGGALVGLAALASGAKGGTTYLAPGPAPATPTGRPT